MVCRLVKARFSATPFDGEGARLFGGRWNHPGVRCSYASETAALAILEILVHLHRATLLDRYAICRATFDDGLVSRLPTRDIPPDWRSFPAPASARKVGDRWIAEGSGAVLRVPSTIVPSEFNYLINPAHPDSSMIRLLPAEPFAIDPRLGRG